MDERSDTRGSAFGAGRPGSDAAGFAVRLRQLRHERGLSLAALSRQVHYSKGYLSKIENGAKPPTEDVARRCDDVLSAGGELLRLLPRAIGEGAAERAVTGEAERSPYRGLSAFTAQDTEWFFGREQATAALLDRVFERVDRGPLMLVAPSGSGKSSLLNAGLMPRMRGGALPMAGSARWPVVVLTPTAHPLQELLYSVAKVLGTDLGVTADDVARDPRLLLRAVDAVTGDGPEAARGERSPRHRLVLLVDQFEEVFTLCADESERRAFIRVLSESAAAEPAGRRATGPEPPAAVVVLGVRADFCGRCLEHPELTAAFADGLFVLGPMTVGELRTAITRPAERAGLTMENGLVQLILRDLQPFSDPRTGPADSTPAPRGALPLLSHALLATWQHREGRVLTLAGYERTAGIRGAVARTAEDVFARLHPGEQKMIRRMLVRLVHVDEDGGQTRRRVDRAALLEQPDEGEDAARALDAFVRARLITLDSDTVEITHEALLHAWPRLRGWIEAGRAGMLVQQQLADAAAEWEREARDPSVLYRGGRLATVRLWAAEDVDGAAALSPQETRFLAASEAEERRGLEQARRQGRQQRRLLAMLTVLLALAVTAGALAVQQRSSALEKGRVARSQALAVASTSLAAGRPEESMLMAARAYRTSPTTEARGALLSTQAQYFAGRLTGQHGPVNDVAFDPAGRRLATASSDGTVAVWRTSDRRRIATVDGSGRVRSVAFSADGHLLAAGRTDGTVQMWDTVRGRTVATVRAHAGRLGDVVFESRGRRWASAGADGRIRLWNGLSPRPVTTLTGHSGGVDALSWSPDGRSLASGGADGTVRLWDVTGHREPVVLTGHTDEVLGTAFSPDGRTLATGGADRTVRLWDVKGHKPVATLTGHGDDVNAVAFTPDGTTVVSACGDGAVRLWDVSGRRLTTTLAGHTDYVMGVAVSPSGALLASAGFDQSTVIWDLDRSVLTARPFTEVWKAAYSPDGTLLASADADHTVRLWDVAEHRQLAVLKGHRGSVFAVAFSPDGRTLASADSDATVRLWNVAERRQLGVLRGHTGSVFAVTFAPDGRTLASAGSDHTVRLWDTATRRRLATLRGHTDFANDVTFSADGRTLASAGDDLTVRLWDAARQRPLGVLRGHSGAVRGVAFSPDGRTLASSGNDGTVRLWRTANRRLVATLSGHTGAVRGVAFSPDGRTLASSGNDRSVRLWDVTGHRQLAALTGHINAVWGVAFAPDGRTLASAGNDGTVRLWDLDLDARLAAVCRLGGTADRSGRGAAARPGADASCDA
ncbi:helix-turn-helix domain-containing protein [Streptomyces sp. NPDC002952]|uniref:nSTAND1 domain-containing NTPase n=1 Tax=Streptomyces sp. NPDC002952 TaxID=3364673 RepID=UPI0036A13B64